MFTGQALNHPAIPAQTAVDGQHNSVFLANKRVPLPVYAVTFASLLIAWGGLWDIMWHVTIGRDGLFSPPHTLMYAGALIAGSSSAYQVLQLTFRKNHPDRAQAVRFWGFFRGTTGSLCCIWGGMAMLSSAPFDNWWHSAYGLDVLLLSPPHVLLLTGIMMLQFGTMINVLGLQNQLRAQSPAPDANTSYARQLRYLFALSAALLLGTLFALFREKLMDYQAHRSQFYILASILFPAYLVAIGRSAWQRYPMTTIASLFVILMLIPSWILQYVPATPKLTPVLNPIDHFQPLHFPLALFIPAFFMDLMLRRFGRQSNDWKLAGWLAIAFLAVFFVVQWPLCEFFLTSPWARNRVLLGYSWPYNIPHNWPYRYQFHPNLLESAPVLARGLCMALVAAYGSARIGLWIGNWLRNVQR